MCHKHSYKAVEHLCQQTPLVSPYRPNCATSSRRRQPSVKQPRTLLLPRCSKSRSPRPKRRMRAVSCWQNDTSAIPRLTSIPASERTTVHIDRQTNDRAAELAAAIGQEIGQNVPKGRVIQALLWAALAPAQDTITARVPVGLNSELIDLAMRR